MAKKPSRGKGRGRGILNVTIGKPNPVVDHSVDQSSYILEIDPFVDQEDFADVADILNPSKELRILGLVRLLWIRMKLLWRMIL
jgi:hypothetical protein